MGQGPALIENTKYELYFYRQADGCEDSCKDEQIDREPDSQFLYLANKIQ